MGRFELENDRIKIAIDSHGGELKSLVKKDTGTEYMWCGDAKYWGRSAPVLFPFVGSVNEQKFRTKGRTYTMGQHGFARDMEFQANPVSDEEIHFILHANEETLAKYPYDFTLTLGYRLLGDGVEISWQVENPSDEALPFSIGGHPAFNCPIAPDVKQTDCFIRFDTDRPLVSTRLEGGLASEERDIYKPKDGGFLPITEHLFDRDALIIEDQNITTVALCTPDKQPYLTVEMDAPLFGVWSPTGKNAPFVCIEPWYGRCDAAGYTGDLSARKWGNLLAPGQTWKKGYRILV